MKHPDFKALSEGCWAQIVFSGSSPALAGILADEGLQRQG